MYRPPITLPSIDPEHTILVEFGDLTHEQQTEIDLHPQRVLRAELPPYVPGVCVVGFRLREGDSREDLYDDIRGWAIARRFPIGRLLDEIP